MKTLWAATILAVLALSAPVSAATCLSLRDIGSTVPNADGSAINFHMRDGKVWRNDLHGKCPDLKFDGFIWQIQGPAEVCENQQALRVIHSGEVCLLGKFTPVAPGKKG